MPPQLRAIIETAVYVDDLDAAVAFYEGIMGLRLIGRDTDRHAFFQVGESSVLLAFLPDETLKGKAFPAHGARGPGHFAMGISSDLREAWRAHLETSGVAIEHEMRWPHGGLSLYFRDPAGNSVELVTPGVWNLPSGW